jgi:hypothetical protein
VLAKLLPALAAVAVLGCGGAAPEADDGEFRPAKAASLPVTLEGMLEISNFEGDREEDGGEGEIGFGIFKSGEDEYLVEVDASLLDAAGLGEGSSRARATLGAESEYGEDSYVITRVEKL